MFSGIYKKATGADPRPEMFMPDGSLSDKGKTTLSDLGMSEDEFARIYQTLDQSLNPEQAARAARASDSGIPLTQGQTTKDFATQEAEQTLKAGIGRESEAARQFESGQQEAIGEASESFRRQFGDVETSRAQRGEQVQSALRGEQKEQKEAIRELYNKASDTGGVAVPIGNDELVDSTYDLVMSRAVDQPVADSVERVMAKFGLIGEEATKKGRFTNVITDDGKNINIRGEVTPLGLDNAEQFRQALNQILPSDRTGAVSGIIRQLDNQVNKTLEKTTLGTERQQAYEAARSAARGEKQTFSQKDIINNLVGYKKGTTTDSIDPALVMDKIYQGKQGITNLRKVKNTLMKNPNNRSLDAWKSVQAQGMSDIFSQAMNPATGDFSGQRLSSAIKRFGGGDIKEGEKKLKLLLGDKYNQFNNLRGAIGDATIPVKGTTNPSGTAYKLLNFMTRMGSVGQFGADAVLGVAGKAKDAAQARSVLKRMESSSPEKVKQAIKANDDLIDAFISLGVQRPLQTE